MGKVCVTEEDVVREFKENFVSCEDVDLIRILQLIHIKEIET